MLGKAMARNPEGTAEVPVTPAVWKPVKEAPDHSQHLLSSRKRRPGEGGLGTFLSSYTGSLAWLPSRQHPLDWRQNGQGVGKAEAYIMPPGLGCFLCIYLVCGPWLVGEGQKTIFPGRFLSSTLSSSFLLQI